MELDSEDLKIYSAIVYSKAFKKDIKLAVAFYVKKKWLVNYIFLQTSHIMEEQLLSITDPDSKSNFCIVMQNKLLGFQIVRPEAKKNSIFTSIRLLLRSILQNMIGCLTKLKIKNHSQWQITQPCITIPECLKDLFACLLSTQIRKKIRESFRNYWIIVKLLLKSYRTKDNYYYICS